MMTYDVEWLIKEMQLSKKEAKSASRFIQKHRKCKRSIGPTFAPVKYVISYNLTSMGSFVKIQCEKCNKEKDISDNVRSNW